MLSKSDIEKIKKETKLFFEKMSFYVEVEVFPEQEGTIPVNLKTDEAKILIGEGGQTLMDVQHLLKAVLRRKIEGLFYLDLDIAGYKKKKAEYLKELARNSADEVAISGIERVLPPMQAYERRIVHMELKERPDVKTESVGEEPERRIVIKPAQGLAF